MKTFHNAVLDVEKGGKSSKDAPETPQRRQIFVHVLEVPTVYDSILEIVPGLHATPPVLPPAKDPEYSAAHLPSTGFDFIMHVGVGRRGYIALEQLAHKTGYNSPDAEGKYAPVVSPPDENEKGPVRGFGAGYEDLPEELHTQIDVGSIKEHLNAHGTEVSVHSIHMQILFSYSPICSTLISARTPGITAAISSTLQALRKQSLPPQMAIKLGRSCSCTAAR